MIVIKEVDTQTKILSSVLSYAIYFAYDVLFVFHVFSHSLDQIKVAL
jgi:hypothetical protein